MRDAATRLGISLTTLEKWCKRLAIEPERHPQDWRFRVLSDEQVEQIRQERAQMPTPQAATLSYRQRDDDRSKSGEGTVRDASPTGRAASRQRPPQQRASSDGGLPDGLVSITEVAETHGLFRYLSTFRRWRDAGKIECDPGEYPGVGGRFSISRPLTQRGLAQFVELASPRRDFVRCAACPHAHAEDYSPLNPRNYEDSLSPRAR